MEGHANLHAGIMVIIGKHEIKKFNRIRLNQIKAVFSKFTIIMLCIVFFMYALSLTGCGTRNTKPSPGDQSTEGNQQSDKVPDDLKEMEESIEKIIKSLDGPAVGIREEKTTGQLQDSEKGRETGEKKPNQESQGSENNEKENKEGKNEKEEGKKESEGKNDEKDSASTQQEQDTSGKTRQTDTWEEITPIINKMHYTWNSYLPDAVKKGANQKTIDDFSNALNSLTNTIISKNKTNTLMAANYLYAYIPDLFSLYRTKFPSEIKRVRYYVRNAMLNSMTANWIQAELDINNLKSTWAVLKNILNEEQQDAKGKLDFSISELEKVIKAKNQPLADIKGRITLANIEELEKSFPQ
ncbi:MAG: hypothetical protein HPY74_03775 [Firmicutes bacterium]|nr:hypothetical protein [Bacillota bacterium]